MFADGYLVGDGSWELRIFVTDLKVERTLRVKGDLHIGGLMFKLVEDLDVAMDWSDHGLWWPQKNMWLTRTRSTLNQYGVQADAFLYFTPMHKVLRIQLPDLRFLDMKVDMSVKCFSAVKGLCKELGIRHPEELSFCRPLSSEYLKKNHRITGATPRQRGRDIYSSTLIQQQHSIHENDIGNRNISPTPYRPTNHYLTGNQHQQQQLDGKSTPGIERTSTPISHWQPNNQTNGSSTLQRHELIFKNGTSPITSSPVAPSVIIGDKSFLHGNEFGAQLPNLSISPSAPTGEARTLLLHPKSLAEKARLNSSWLDSSLSLYEQDVREFDLLLLRFKFYSFYDLNPKLDAVRINQIYEQARWSLLTEEVECTENEAMMFAALQVQAHMQAKNPNPDEGNSKNDDDIDAALNDLQSQLEGGSISLNGSSTHHSLHHHHSTTSPPYGHQYSNPGDVIHVPELSDYLRFSKPRRFTLKTTKKLYFVFRETRLSAFRTREDRFAEPSLSINLRGCEITPDVNLSQLRYGIKLEVPQQDGMTEYNLRFNSEEQYAKWLAAFRLASKGKTMSDTAYENEVRQILDFLSIQHPAPAPSLSVHSVDINPDDYVPPKFLRKLKGRNQIVSRILEAHANVRGLGLTEAKLRLIKGWQALPDYGVSLFIVKFAPSKKEELLGVTSNKLMRLDINTGDHIKTWRFNTMKAWNVNWEIKQMLVQFEEEDVRFSCPSADCKVVHEFIGGYIFLSMRSKEANQSLNEELFHKLTGGWD